MVRILLVDDITPLWYVNCNDLTTTSLVRWLVREIIPFYGLNSGWWIVLIYPEWCQHGRWEIWFICYLWTEFGRVWWVECVCFRFYHEKMSYSLHYYTVGIQRTTSQTWLAGNSPTHESFKRNIIELFTGILQPCLIAGGHPAEAGFMLVLHAFV